MKKKDIAYTINHHIDYDPSCEYIDNSNRCPNCERMKLINRLSLNIRINDLLISPLILKLLNMKKLI